jgi:putative spermidine/putrescine transport system ATP-binding protein
MTDLGLPHLIVRNVSKRFGTTTVLDRVDLTIRRGELVTLLGPSGCGKTTLLRAIAGLAQPDQGQVELAGRDITLVPPHRRNVGVVFQSYALFPHLTVAGNIAFGLKVRGRARAEIEAAVERALSLVKLEHLAKRRISALSGGQQQRVALARAIAVEPDVLLFDEALSALDRKLREEMQVELRRLLQNVGATAIFVTHDQDEALTMSDRVAVMNKGRIEQLAEPRARG